jgi:antitoxin (DNA-binding transcriptional repressor) of toxin-antitoxin stability system
MTAKTVSMGVREFREKATQLLSGRQSVIVTKHGEPSGIFIPLPKKSSDPSDLEAAIKRLEATFVKLEKLGLSREEIENLLSDDSDNEE